MNEEIIAQVAENMEGTVDYIYYVVAGVAGFVTSVVLGYRKWKAKTTAEKKQLIWERIQKEIGEYEEGRQAFNHQGDRKPKTKRIDSNSPGLNAEVARRKRRKVARKARKKNRGH
jgi:hypothetical protein